MTNKLRQVRQVAGRRMWELAALSGVSASTLSAIERYDYKPRDATMRRIAAALLVQTEDIWPLHNEPYAQKHDEANVS